MEIPGKGLSVSQVSDTTIPMYGGGTSTPNSWDIWKRIERQKEYNDLAKIINQHNHIGSDRRLLKTTPLKESSISTGRFKGIRFKIKVSEMTNTCFESLTDITAEEMRMAEAIYPVEFAEIKVAWKEAWLLEYAEKEFYLED